MTSKTYEECLKDLTEAKALEVAVRRVEEAMTTLTRLRDETRALADRIGAEGVAYSIFDSTVIALKDVERFVAARRAEAADAYYRENVEMCGSTQTDPKAHDQEPPPIRAGDRVVVKRTGFVGRVTYMCGPRYVLVAGHNGICALSDLQRLEQK